MTNANDDRSGRPIHPRFTGITTYRDPQRRFELRHPSDWTRSELDNDLDGILLQPVASDDATYFAVWVSPLDLSVVAEDLPDLRDGFDAGLAELPDSMIEHADERTYNDIVKLDRTLTFTEQGKTRKRHVWGLYADRWQYVLVYQGSSPDEFHYWLSMGNYCFNTLELPQSLWFATDPSLAPSAAAEPAE